MFHTQQPVSAVEVTTQYITYYYAYIATYFSVAW